jgi:L-lactate dehydrogenase complex protein LldE
MAEHWVRTFDPELPVVAPSGSCVAMIRHGYRALLEGHPLYGRWEALAARTYELSQYLVDVLGIEGPGDPARGSGDLSSFVPSPADVGGCGRRRSG